MKTISLPEHLPADAQYDPQENLLYVTYYGELAPGQITQVSKFIATCDIFRKNLNTLIDYSQSSIKTDVEATMNFLEYIQTIADQIGHPKWAIISGSKLNSAMFRRLIFLTENLPIKMKEFEHSKDALEWLKS